MCLLWPRMLIAIKATDGEMGHINFVDALCCEISTQRGIQLQLTPDSRSGKLDTATVSQAADYFYVRGG